MDQSWWSCFSMFSYVFLASGHIGSALFICSAPLTRRRQCPWSSKSAWPHLFWDAARNVCGVELSISPPWPEHPAFTLWPFACFTDQCMIYDLWPTHTYIPYIPWMLGTSCFMISNIVYRTHTNWIKLETQQHLQLIDIKRAIALIPFTGRGWIPTRPTSCLWPIPASTSGCVGKALPIFVWWDQVWLSLFS